ncbi:hypothetical protein [Actinokineospora sp. NPDC004072]
MSEPPSAHALARWTVQERVVTHAVEVYPRPAEVVDMLPAALAGAGRVGFRPSARAFLPTTTTAVKRTSADLVAAMMTPQDLAAVGEVEFLGAGQDPYLERCLQAKPTAKSRMLWQTPNQRAIIHSVESYAVTQVWVLRSAAECLVGFGPFEPEPKLGELGMHAQYSWCFHHDQGRGCGAVAAKDDLLTAVVVEAGSTAAARAMVVRLMPVAVEALGRL